MICRNSDPIIIGHELSNGDPSAEPLKIVATARSSSQGDISFCTPLTHGRRPQILATRLQASNCASSTLLRANVPIHRCSKSGTHIAKGANGSSAFFVNKAAHFASRFARDGAFNPGLLHDLGDYGELLPLRGATAVRWSRLLRSR
jgi:hypothetical protein